MSPHHRRTALMLFALGATVGTGFDWLHVVSGTTAYADPGLWGQPFWVPILFGSAGVALGLGRLLLGRLLREAPKPLTGAAAAGGLGMFFLAYLESAFLPNPLATAMLALTSLTMLLWLDRSPAGLLAAAAAALVGPSVEILLTHLGAFLYVDATAGGPYFLGVAYWLPLLYVSASAAVGGVARWHAKGA